MPLWTLPRLLLSVLCWPHSCQTPPSCRRALAAVCFSGACLGVIPLLSRCSGGLCWTIHFQAACWGLDITSVLLAGPAVLSLSMSSCKEGSSCTQALLQGGLQPGLQGLRIEGLQDPACLRWSRCMRTVLLSMACPASSTAQVAHRLDHIMACQTAVVMGQGEILEQGPPAELAADPGSAFYAMRAAQLQNGQ